MTWRRVWEVLESGGYSLLNRKPKPTRAEPSSDPRRVAEGETIFSGGRPVAAVAWPKGIPISDEPGQRTDLVDFVDGVLVANRHLYHPIVPLRPGHYPMAVTSWDEHHVILTPQMPETTHAERGARAMAIRQTADWFDELGLVVDDDPNGGGAGALLVRRKLLSETRTTP